MPKQRDGHQEERRLAKQLARAHDELAARQAILDRAEEDRARELAQTSTSGATQGAAPGAATRVSRDSRQPGKQRHPLEAVPPKKRALLIINTKSGPNNDSILRLRELVERLAAHGIQAKVRVKLRKKIARKQAHKAAKKGCELVIVAGGDGTVAAVAEGLLGTRATLGIIPLGTYNNVATSLGIPTALDEAVALIAGGVVRAIDVGRVTAAGANRKRIFLEMAAAGVTAALMPVGQDVKAGRWQSASSALPAALEMIPTGVALRLDKGAQSRQALTLLVEIANAPRSGPGVITSPDARLDDGLLDVAVYHEHGQAALAARFLALKTGLVSEDTRIERVRARRIDVRTDHVLPVVADSKVVGHTPARFEVLPGSLMVAAGRGIGLVHQPPIEVVQAATIPARLMTEDQDPAEATALAVAAPVAAPEQKGLLSTAVTTVSNAAEVIAPAVRGVIDSVVHPGAKNGKGHQDGQDPLTSTP